MPASDFQGPPGLGLEAWLAGRGLLPLQFEPLAGDVGARRYYRLRLAGGATAVLAVVPDDHLDVCRRFRRTTVLLEAAGVRAPAIVAIDCERGWTVVEDLGPETLYDRGGRPWGELAPYYDSAAAAIGRIAALPPAAVAALSPPLDRDLLRRELDQTWEVLLAPRRLAGEPAVADSLRRALEELCDRLAEASPVPCHRDLMPRNLVPLAGGGVAVLDHQDLRLGPPGYDLASLLNDSLFPPPEIEEPLVARWAPGDGGRLQYHRAAAQRTLKAAGTFARFAARGSGRHLRLVPPTLERALRHLAALPETAAVIAPIEPRWRRLAESDLLD
jgi:hypothetical protein